MFLAGVTALDIVRLHAARYELQVFLDEAVRAASVELDGTVEGLRRAQTVAQAGRRNFPTPPTRNVTVEFAIAAGGPFTSTPASPAGQCFVRLQGSARVNLYLLPLVPGMAGADAIAVSAVAGQCRRSSMSDGLPPFSPGAYDLNDPFWQVAARGS